MAWQDRIDHQSPDRPNDQRTPFQRDKARILHSAAFRRLQAKTQVMYVGMHDFPRTRLTHSLEASQIGSGLVSFLRQQNQHPELTELLSESLVESLCLAHDIGHPPFGHGGEIALNYMMREHGGFEGNGQTFRIVTQLEPYTEHYGMNLTRRTLLGLMKYPVRYSQVKQHQLPTAVEHFRHLPSRQWLPPKALYDDDWHLVEWVFSEFDRATAGQFQSLQQPPSDSQHGSSRFRSIDAGIMEIADDIAYGVHDLEDAIVVGLIDQALWQQQVLPILNDLAGDIANLQPEALTQRLFAKEHYSRKQAIGGLVNLLLTSVTITESGIDTEQPLVKYQATLGCAEKQLLKTLKQFIFRWVIRKPEMQQQEFKGQQIVMELFDALSVEPERLLPYNTQHRYQQAIAEGKSGYRVISDYLSGMTDAYAARLYRELFNVNNTLPL